MLFRSAVLNNQPQGGFITRKPTPRPVEVPVASNDGFGFGFFRFQPDPPPQPVNTRRRGGQQYYQPAQPAQQGWGW